jgi:integrase
LTQKILKIAPSKFRFDNPDGFSGPLAKQCREFILQKQALGLKYGTETGLLGAFDRYLRDSGAPENALLKEYVVGFAAKQLGESDKSFSNRGTVLRLFGEYMGRMGYESYVLPYYEKHISSFVPYIYTHDEIKRIFAELDRTPYRSQGKYAHKVYPMLFRILYGCGLRIGEALGLKPRNVDLNTGIMRLENTKWNSERLVPMSDSLLIECRNYCNEMHSTGRFEYFFPSSLVNGTAVSGCAAHAELKRVLAKCKITEKARIHDFRHTFCVHLLNKWASDGKDIYICLPNLSKYIGHSKISATEDYLRLTAEVYPEVTQTFEAHFGEVIPEVVTFEKIS